MYGDKKYKRYAFGIMYSAVSSLDVLRISYKLILVQSYVRLYLLPLPPGVLGPADLVFVP